MHWVTRMAEEKDLDDMLMALGRDAPEPSSDLLGRVLEDAYEMQPVEAIIPPIAPVQGPWAQILGVLGGWGGLGGLSFAASIGFVLGFSPPAALVSPLSYVLGDELAEYDATVSGFGWDLEEG